MRVTFLALCCLIFCGCATPQAQRSLDELIDGPCLSTAQTGVLVRSLRTGGTLYSRNADKLFIPASNMKLYTTAAALQRLGPNFRFDTSLSASGEVRDGVLHGNLIVRGSGDPTLSSRYLGRSSTSVFEEWADRLASSGIQEVTGRVIVDDRLFDDRYLGKGWAWDDEAYCYSAQVSALSFNDNRVLLTIAPGSDAGDQAAVALEPQTAYVTVDNVAATGAPSEGTRLNVSRPPGSNRIRVSGKISAGAEPRVLCVTVHDPALFAGTVLKEVLEKRGIRIHGPVSRPEAGPSGTYSAERARPVAGHRSPPLAAILEQVNKPSHNLPAELLLKTLGARFAGEGSARAGVSVVEGVLAEAGVQPGAFAMYDGSGLSRMNLVSPAATVALLAHMYGLPGFSIYYGSLPRAGREGTLTRRMRFAEAEPQVRAKTGTLTNHISLSGYAEMADGEMIAFSIMSNNALCPVEEMRRIQDEMCLKLIRLAR